MPQRDHIPRRARARRAGLVAALSLVGLVSLSGCRASIKDGLLLKGADENATTVTRLWVGGWIALIAVGLLVLGLIIWCLVRYRRKPGDNELPPQLKYNVPLEVLYTVVPVLMIAVFFVYTARDESTLLDVSKKPDETINVVGKQWSWDFNYVEPNVHEAGTQAELTGKPGVEATLPTLWLPVNQRVQFDLTSRDVIHSFWIPAFLQKLDMIPGRVNRFQVVPTELGTFQGKCAELCGAYHSQMLFNVKVVSRADFDAHMAQLRAEGNDGLLPNSLNRSEILPKDEHLLPGSTS
ncbi:putative cytochrome c oxidase subunit 2 [Nostocoides japonicum T1-X7]|uniref:cytochrome-c oxidase n=1 Tax=Nostocoides japonicum T1-X7 TaxID=1194083 RepID=A0A077M7V2_9MICO|nr:cytochrome c oxidase subunit II [Tetrasphaera japonica]CCH80130.1 putative cytochrome c oxidase subunit 2 [Tetrasphaera japonica T1-X7]